MPDKLARKLVQRKTLRVAGLMSGTSADGVDVAIVDLSPSGVKVRAFAMYPYPPAMRKRVFALFEPGACGVADVCEMNFVLGEFFARALIDLARRSRIALRTIDLVGSHGQTIWHDPRGVAPALLGKLGRRARPRGRIRSTLQIAEPSIIARRTGIATVADFRPADIAAGGQGAPLVPFADMVLFGHPERPRALQNIGGIANVTYLPALGTRVSWHGQLARMGLARVSQGHPAPAGTRNHKSRCHPQSVVCFGGATPPSPNDGPEGGTCAFLLRQPAQGFEKALEGIRAFDTGPGNMIIDRVTWRVTGGRKGYDAGGRLAAGGKVNAGLLGELMRHPYLRRRPPKTTGREMFGASFTDALYDRAMRRGLAPRDVLATVTAFTAASIAQAYRRHLPSAVQEVIVCGGGANNLTLMAMLRRELAGASVLHMDETGLRADAKEAVSFAILAAATAMGQPSNVPSATGAAQRAILGKILPAGL